MRALGRETRDQIEELLLDNFAERGITASTVKG